MELAFAGPSAFVSVRRISLLRLQRNWFYGFYFELDAV
jgi:hypothetical protein